MRTGTKRVDELGSKDLDEFPVWTFVNELLVRPVGRIPVRDLSGSLVATRVVLANGTSVRAVLGNIDLANPRATQHFLTLSVDRDGQRFHLARYFDADYSARGPAALARFLGLALGDVFPIAYDIRTLVRGAPEAACGIVPLEVKEKLSRADLIAMAVP